MAIITVDKSAITHNEKNNCWATKNRRNPIRVSKHEKDLQPINANVVEIKDAYGNTVAAIVASKDGKPIENHGTTVVLFTSYPVVIKA